MSCPTANRMFLPTTIGLGLAALASGLASGAQTRVPPGPARQSNATSFGNIRIQFSHVRGNFRTGTFTMTGPDVKIESRDISQPTQFVLLADQVVGKRVPAGKRETAVADLTGRIRYTVFQKTREGVRTIQGTAGHASYDEAARQIRLMDGVRATLTEEARLEGPATLRSSSAVIMTDRSGRYTLAGDPGVNDIQFTSRRKAKVKDQAEPQPIAGAPVHLHGFRSGEITPGRSIALVGAETQLEVTDPVANSSGRLTAERIMADFGTAIDHAEATGGVRFHYERPGSKEGRQILNGSSETATYDAAARRLTVAGSVEATIVDPASLLEPAHITAGKVTAYSAPPRKNDANQQERSIVEITGAPERNSLVFRPRPREKRQQEGAAAGNAPVSGAQRDSNPLQSFALGTVRVTGFDSGTFEPGHDALLAGDQTLLRTEDRQAHTSSLLRASRLTARFAADRTLEQLDAVGSVRFHLQQPVRKAPDAQPEQAAAPPPTGRNPAEAGPQTEIFDATATRATVAATTGGQILTVPGPWHTSQTTGDPDRRDISVGETGDTLTYNLSTGDLNMDTPGRTAYFQTVPVKPKTAQVKKPSAPPRKRQNR